jgi:hypothetical protein
VHTGLSWVPKLTDGRAQVLIEPVQGREGPVADVALVACAIPGARCGLVLVGAGPADEFLGDGAVGVLGADEFVESVAAEARGVWTCARLEMVREAAGGDMGRLAKGARDVLAAMLTRVEVLWAGRQS